MAKMISSLFVALSFMVFSANAQSSSSGLLIFAGAASKPATEQAVNVFKEKTGVSVDVVFGAGFCALPDEDGQER